MRSVFIFRLGSLITAFVVVACLTAWGVQHSWQRIQELERTLTAGHLESFRLADGFQQRLLRLNNAMMRYAARREPATWTEFEQAGTQLDLWIDRYDPRLTQNTTLTTDRERELFKRLNDAYDGYLMASRYVRTNQQPPLVSAQGFAQLDDFERQAERLLQLGLQLAHAHRAAEESFLEESNRSLESLRGFLFGGVAFMFALVGALGLVVYRDLIGPLRTRLVRNQALLEQQEKLATLGTLAAGIAHEVRNPLTSIKARLYALDKHLESPTHARADVQIINSEITRLERIVQDVLSFARPSEPVKDCLSVPALLGEVQELMSASLAKQQVELVLEPGPVLFIQGDPAHLKQVLINLIRNAAEAINGVGRVTLSAHADEAALNGAVQPVVVLEVADSGCGISPEVEQRLFDPFYSTKETGTGLGLSIAARIVGKHGGNLQYRTHLGHGTVFGIVLSRQADPVLDPPKRDAAVCPLC